GSRPPVAGARAVGPGAGAQRPARRPSRPASSRRRRPRRARAVPVPPSAGAVVAGAARTAAAPSLPPDRVTSSGNVPARRLPRPPLRAWLWTAGALALALVAVFLWRISDARATSSTTAP